MQSAADGRRRGESDHHRLLRDRRDYAGNAIARSGARRHGGAGAGNDRAETDRRREREGDRGMKRIALALTFTLAVSAAAQDFSDVRREITKRHDQSVKML